MGKIILLDENTSNRIAAGEVVERPASVIKELVENSIDAGALSISVEIKNGGITYMKVSDNGSGMEEDDVEIAFERHATSKIKKPEDLESISTLGFRGEALASIAAVSIVELTTRVSEKPYGVYLRINGGIVEEKRQTGCPVGSTFIVKNLFYNTPARFKFLKKDTTEAGYISDLLGRIALANPHISFKLVSNNSVVMHTPGNNDLLSTIFSIYGKEVAKDVCKIDYVENGIKVRGYAGKSETSRSNRNYQSVFVNGRYVKSKVVTSAIDEAYKTLLMKNKFPFIVINIEVDPKVIDVNVHPAKMEIRFSDEQQVFRAVYYAINSALLEKPLIKSVELKEKDRNVNPFIINQPDIDKDNYLQQELKLKENKTDQLFEDKDAVIQDAADKNGVRQYAAADKKQAIRERAISSYGAFAVSDKKIDGGATYEETKDALLKGMGKNNILEAKVIGQLFSTYIVLQYHDEILLIDQHAAHERIMYEKIKSQYFKDVPLSQALISPQVIELTSQEIKILEENRDFFNKLGFNFESFGNNSIILRSVPLNESIDSRGALCYVLDKITGQFDPENEDKVDDILYTIACKAAVKANMELDDIEINKLLIDLSEIDYLYTCPHGRPTIVRITKYEIEKMFKRIV